MIRMSYYQSMLSSKNKIFQSIIKSIQPEKDQGSNAEFVQTMADLNAKFSRITQECQQWDMVYTYFIHKTLSYNFSTDINNNFSIYRNYNKH